MRKKSSSRSGFVSPRALIALLLCGVACCTVTGIPPTSGPAFFRSQAPTNDKNRPVANRYGAPVLNANGHHVTYDRKTLEAMADKADVAKQTNGTAANQHTSRVVKARRFAPTGGQTAAAVLAICHLWRWYWR